MADITLDSLITQLKYEANTEVIDKAEKALEKLEASNRASAKTTDELSAKQLALSGELAKTKQRTNELREQKSRLLAEVKKETGATKEQEAQLKRLDAELRTNQSRARELGQQNAQLGLEKRKVSLAARQLTRDQRQLAAATNRAAAAAAKETTILSSLGAKLKSAVGSPAAVAAMATVALASGIRAIADETARLDKIAKGGRTSGLGSEQYQVLSHLANLAGTSVDGLSKSTIVLNKNLLEIGRGSGKAANQALEDVLGKGAAARLTGKSQTEQLGIIGDALNRVEDEGQRAALAVQIFGKSGSDLLPLLAQGSAGIDEMASKVGTIFTPEQLEAAERYQDALTEFKKAMGDLTGGAIVQLAPILQKLIEYGTELFQRFSEGGAVTDALTALLDPLVELLILLTETLLDSSSASTEFAAAQTGTIATLLQAAVSLFQFVKRLKDLKDQLGFLASPLKLLFGALRLLLLPFELLAKAVIWLLGPLGQLLDLLDPLLKKFKDFKDSIPSLSDVFSGLGSAISGLASKFGLLNSELVETGSLARSAYEELERLRKQGDMSGRTDAELQEIIQGGGKESEKASAEVRKRVAEREATERAEDAKQTREDKVAAKGKRLEKIINNPDKASRAQLIAITRDFNVPEKTREKAQAELDKRAKKAGKSGADAAKKERESLLTAQVAKDIEKLAEQAGQREAARAIAAGEKPEEVNRRELARRKQVQSSLSTRFAETGELPPGITQDLAQVANLPNIEQVGGRVAPPVISVTNMRFDVSNNTFEANIEVAGTSATPGEIAQAVLSQARPVHWEDFGRAIMNQVTTLRRG